MSSAIFLSFFCFVSLPFFLNGINLLEICQSGIRDDGSNYVHCARKSLVEIPSFSSHRFFNLAFDELILSDNAITHIKANAFNGLRIKRLIMSGNRLKSIDKNAFRELENYLEQLTLEFDGSIVDTIPEAIKTNLANIRSLTLTGLNLRQLTSNTFDQMKKLESLSFKSCRLQLIDDDGFQSIDKQLKHLYLDQNQLDQRILSSLQRLHALETLSLSHNRINRFDLTMMKKNLRFLDLSYNGLMKLTFTNRTNLQIFNVQNNQLTSEQILGSIPNQLKELILDFNAIRSFRDDFIPTNNSLETLSIQSNDFTLNDANVFRHLNSLKRLNLARNNIKTIPKDLFVHTRSLEHLNLDRNPFLPLSTSTFSGLESSLKNFSCQSCSLTSSSLISFARLINLERLKLQSNLLKEIRPIDLFSSMRKLISIDLQRNQLTFIPTLIFPQTLRELELANNQLTHFVFDNQTEKYLIQLNTLDLSSNPLNCDCRMRPIHRWLFNHFQLELVPYVQWICATPIEHVGKKLGVLKESDLICEEPQTTTTTTTSTTTTTKFVEVTTQTFRSMPTFHVWLKDAETAILEWTRISSPLSLIVFENNLKLSELNLNSSENYFLLEHLKPSTNYSLCLRNEKDELCRRIVTPIKEEQKLLSLSSSTKSVENHSFISDIQYLITGIACGILVVLLILLVVMIFFIRQRWNFHQSSKTIGTDSFYQTTGSDTTHIGGSCSLEDSSTGANASSHLTGLNSTPIFYYCRSPTTIPNCCPTDPTAASYHFYHEIPLQSSSSSQQLNHPCLCRTPVII